MQQDGDTFTKSFWEACAILLDIIATMRSNVLRSNSLEMTLLK